jgi:omega-6 fatty acid desaturase (delta-12 desaturase)
LISCHNEYQHLFADVTRVKLSQVPKALKYILWDTRAQRIISVAEYRRQIKVIWHGASGPAGDFV